jgi:hypothetical protein
MSSWLGKFHDFTKKYDPLGHALVDAAWKTSTKTVNESSRAMRKAGDAVGVDTTLPAYGEQLSQKDKDSFSRWGENTLGAAGAIYGAGAALGGSGGAAGGGSSSAGALGSSGVPWAGGVDAGASGLGYAEAGGGFVGNAGAGGGTGSFFGSGGGMGNLSQLGRLNLGQGQQGQDTRAMQQQQQVAQLMREQEQRRRAEEVGELPGWVNMEGSSYG